MLLVFLSCCSCMRVCLPLAKVVVVLLLLLLEINHVTGQSQNKVGLRERKKGGGAARYQTISSHGSKG